MLAFKGHAKVQIPVTSLDVIMLRQTTHVQRASWAGVWPTDELLTVASLLVSDSSLSILKTALWKLDTQNFWICQTCTERGRHHRQSLSCTVSRTLSSALSPTTLVADHSASTATTSSKLLQYKKTCKLLGVQNVFTDFRRWDSIMTTIYGKPQFCVLTSTNLIITVSISIQNSSGERATRPDRLQHIM